MRKLPGAGVFSECRSAGATIFPGEVKTGIAVCFVF